MLLVHERQIFIGYIILWVFAIHVDLAQQLPYHTQSLLWILGQGGQGGFCTTPERLAWDAHVCGVC